MNFEEPEVEKYKKRIKKLENEIKIYKSLLSNLTNKYQKKIDELSMVRRISDTIHLVPDLEAVCKTIVEVMIDEMKVENCSIMLFYEKTQILKIKAANGRKDKSSSYYNDSDNIKPFNIGEGIAGWVAKYRKSVLIKDITKDSRWANIDSIKNIGSMMCVPLMYKKRLYGVLNMSHPFPNFLSEEDVQLIEIIAGPISLSLETVKLFLKLKKANISLEENVNKRTEELVKSNEELIHTRDRLILTEKLAVVGNLVRNLAHEINNPLFSIQNSIIMISKIIGIESLGQKYCNISYRELERINSILKKLLDFSPLNEELFIKIQVNKLITEATNHFKLLEKLNIKIINKIDFPIFINSSSKIFVQLFINIFQNSIDSIKNNGEIQISAKDNEDNYEIIVEDNGKGIKHENLGRIFEPFYSTKKEMSGVGLGLTVVQNIIYKHEAFIEIESQEDEFTKVSMKFPKINF